MTILHIPEVAILRDSTNAKSGPLKVRQFPAKADSETIFSGGYYLAKIAGEDDNPVLLELRFVSIGEGKYIALLMTDQRTSRALSFLAHALIEKLQDTDQAYDAIAAPQSLGPLLATHIALGIDADIPMISLMKGKIGPRGKIIPPKQWIDPRIYTEVRSGTSGMSVEQRLYMDNTFVEPLRLKGIKKVLLVDDARLHGGTLDASISLLQGMYGFKVVQVATVLNEHSDESQIQGIPYTYLTRLPLFEQVDCGYRPIKGTYESIEYFYAEI